MNLDYWDKKGIIICSIIGIMVLGLIGATVVFALQASSSSNHARAALEESEGRQKGQDEMKTKTTEIGQEVEAISRLFLRQLESMIDTNAITAEYLQLGKELAGHVGKAEALYQQFKQANP